MPISSCTLQLWPWAGAFMYTAQSRRLTVMCDCKTDTRVLLHPLTWRMDRVWHAVLKQFSIPRSSHTPMKSVEASRLPLSEITFANAQLTIIKCNTNACAIPSTIMSRSGKVWVRAEKRSDTTNRHFLPDAILRSLRRVSVATNSNGWKAVKISSWESRFRSSMHTLASWEQARAYTQQPRL